MKTFNELEKCYDERINIEFENDLKKYKKFIKCVSEILSTIFNKEICKIIATYITFLELEFTYWTTCATIKIEFFTTKGEGIEDIIFKDFLQGTEKSIYSSDKEIVEFFRCNNIFSSFYKILYVFHPGNDDKNNITKYICDQVNKKIFDKYDGMIKKLNMPYDTFIKSDYSFQVDEEICKKCDNIIKTYLDSNEDEISTMTLDELETLS